MRKLTLITSLVTAILALTATTASAQYTEVRDPLNDNVECAAIGGCERAYEGTVTFTNVYNQAVSGPYSYTCDVTLNTVVGAEDVDSFRMNWDVHYNPYTSDPCYRWGWHYNSGSTTFGPCNAEQEWAGVLDASVGDGIATADAPCLYWGAQPVNGAAAFELNADATEWTIDDEVFFDHPVWGDNYTWRIDAQMTEVEDRPLDVTLVE